MRFFIDWINKYPILKNKYAITLTLFLGWIVFFDKNSLVNQYKDRQVLFELKKEKRYYQDEILNTRRQLNELLSDSRSLEKFAREHYLMKKDNEDIWLVIDKSENTQQN